ncbi:serine protease inhibitor [Colletes latitarsis]|uniref:serine protease inhibitor n=1 Tax=Colletes latitarsis TaxID=2605962 RepID=UPI004036D2C0
MKLLRVHYITISFFLVVYLETITGAILYRPNKAQIVTSCGENEVYSFCEADPSCEKACDNIDIWESGPCTRTKSCMDGCICEEGYVRDENRACVWENSCPRVRH